MSTIPKLFRMIAVVLAFGLVAGQASIASAERGDTTSNQLIGRETLADNGDLVEQLVQVLIDILDELLNPGGNLEDLLPEGCSVEVGGFVCDVSSAEASLFLGEHCDPSIFDEDVYLCSIADVVYSCNIYGPTTALICNVS